MDLPKKRMTLAIGVAAAGIVTAAMVVVVWPALVRPEPPLEKAGDEGLRISLVEPPNAPARTSSLLDVGVSDAVQAMAKGREALFVRVPPVKPLPGSRPRVAPERTQQTDELDDTMPPPEAVDDRWERDARRRDLLEQTQRRRWEADQQAQEAREERAAREHEASARRRWESERERERYDDRYAPAPYEERGPPSERW